jgi:hypothetical protein
MDPARIAGVVRRLGLAGGRAFSAGWVVVTSLAGRPAVVPIGAGRGGCSGVVGCGFVVRSMT